MYTTDARAIHGYLSHVGGYHRDGLRRGAGLNIGGEVVDVHCDEMGELLLESVKVAHAVVGVESSFGKIEDSLKLVRVLWRRISWVSHWQ